MKKTCFWTFLIYMLFALCLGVAATETVYVDGTGADASAYSTLEEALEALPLIGGTVVICGDTAASADSELDLPAKNVKIVGENGAALTFRRSVNLGGDTVFENIKLINGTSGRLNLSCMGHNLTVGENVETDMGSAGSYLYAGAADSVDVISGGSITLLSGTWGEVHAGSFSVAHSGEVTMLVDGATITGGLVLGNNSSGGNFIGTCNATVKSGSIARLRTKNATGILSVVLHGGTVENLEMPVTVTPTVGGSVTINSITGAGLVLPKAAAGYVIVQEGTVYTQVPGTEVSDVVYVNSTEHTENEYSTLEEALEALPLTGGTVVICGDTATSADSELDFPAKNVKIVGENGAALTFKRSVNLGGDTVFENIKLINGTSGRLNLSCMGHNLTVGENVETDMGSAGSFLYAGTKAETADTISGGSITLLSGTWGEVHAGSFNVAHSGEVTMLVDGATITGGLVLGNNSSGGNFIGTCNATVKSGSIARLRTKNSTGILSAVLHGGTVASLEMPATVTPVIGGSVTINAITGAGLVLPKAAAGYVIVQNGTVYTQVPDTEVSDVVYVNSTEHTENEYDTLEEALEALPLTGGTVVICGDTAASADSELNFPAKDVKITGENGATLTFKRSVNLGGDTVFENIKLVNGTSGRLNLSCMGHALTVGENVETDMGSAGSYLYAGTKADSGDTISGGSITLLSGTWGEVHAGSFSVAHSGEVTMLVDGATITGGLVLGNNSSGGNFIGTCNATVKSGSIARLRTKNATGTLFVTVTGGTVASLEMPVTVEPAIGGSVTVSAITADGAVTTKAAEGYLVICEGTVYKQCAIGAGPAYVDGTGATPGAFTTIEEAYMLLADTGGSIIVSGDTSLGTDGEMTTLPKRSGVVTISGQNDATFTFAGTVVLDGDLAFEDVILSSSGTLYAGGGNTLTFGDTVSVSGAPLAIMLGKDGTAIVDIDAVTVTAEEGCETVVNGNTYTARLQADIIVGYVSNVTGSNANNGLTDETPKQTQGQIDGDGLRGLLYGGGYAVLCGVLEVGGGYTWDYGGPIVVTACYGGKDYRNADADTGVFRMPEGTVITVGGDDLTFKNVLIRTGANSRLRVLNGATVTIDDTCTVLGEPLVVEVGRNGTAIVDNAAVTVTAAAGYALVRDGDTYTVSRLPVVGYISNATGHNANDGLTDESPKQTQGQPDGNGVRNLLYGGGTLVVSGEFNIENNYTWDYGGAITLTGSFGGKDYKNKNANTGIFKQHAGTITLTDDLTMDDILFHATEGAVIHVPDGVTFTVTDSVVFLTDLLTVIVEKGGTANIASGRYAAIRGEGTIHVTHCAHPAVTEGVAHAAPTCAQNGLRYDQCKVCGLHIGVPMAEIPVDPNAHALVWTYGETEAVATCTNGCGYTATQDYAPVTEIHVSSAGTAHGDLTAESPINDFGAAMAIAAAQRDDVTVYIHDYAIIPNNGAHASWNAYAEPAHTNTITVSGYSGLASLRFNNESGSRTMLYLLSGPTTFDNLEFSAWGALGTFSLVARHNKLVIGETVSADVFHKGSDEFNIIGGCYWEDFSPAGGCADLDTDVTVLSGNYTNIYGGAYNNAKCCVDAYTYRGTEYSGGDVHLTVGNTSVRRQLVAGNFGGSSVYANMNDIYIDIVGPITVMRYFSFVPSGATYRAQNVYLRLYGGEVRVGEELPDMFITEYTWGCPAGYEALTARIAGKLYVFGDGTSGGAMGLYKTVTAELAAKPENDGKWEASVLDETYCDVNRGDHTSLGDAIEHHDATCTADGYDLYTCADCGETYAEKIDRVPHTYGDATTIAATCMAPEMERKVCTACGNAKHTVVGAVYAEHTDPEKSGCCKVCNRDLTVDCAHTDVTVTEITTACGSGEKRYCNGCGKTEVDITGGAHKYGAYVMTVEPTVYTAGVKTRTCKVCGKVDTAWINAGNAASAMPMAVEKDGSLTDLSVKSTRLSAAEKAALDALLQQKAYGSEVKVSYETVGDVVKKVTYMIPLPAEYTEYKNIRVAVRLDNGELRFVHFEVNRGYIMFVF